MLNKNEPLCIDIFGCPSSDEQNQGKENEDEQNCRNSLFYGVCDDEDTPRREDGSMRRQYSDMGENYHRIHEEKEGRMIDLRLLMLLEYFRELYVRKIEVLKQMFPGAKDEFVYFFKKIGLVLSKSKTDKPTFKTMQRSLSFGSPRFASKGIDFESDMRLNRFKVTTPDTGNVPPSGSGGGSGGVGGATKPGVPRSSQT